MMFCLTCAAVSMLQTALPHETVRDFPQGIDAVSVAFPTQDQHVDLRYRQPDGIWSDWQALQIENEQDPSLRESNLVMFPKGVTRIDVRTAGSDPTLHPIILSDALPDLRVTRADSSVTAPFIMTRSQWGADESLTLTSAPPKDSSPSAGSATTDAGDNGGSSKREQECIDDQKNYPDEFKVASTTRTDADGKTLKWAWQYSPTVKLFVVHHTAGIVSGDGRSGLERMRALYQYHAINRGWGDIGYHYVIDDQGQVYEGKAGGKGVVGGHAYCHNVDTIGISLMGNFDEERPTQAQVKALQKLLVLLADTYDVDLKTTTTYHGKAMPRVVGHRDLLSTDCPGFAMYGVLDQVRKHIQSGDVSLGVNFPAWPEVSTKSHQDQAEQRRLERQQKRGLPAVSSSSASSGPRVRTGFYTFASTTITGRPGMKALITLTYGAGPSGLKAGAVAGEIYRAEDGIGLWLVNGDDRQRLGQSVTLPARVNAGATLPVTFEIQFPMQTGTSTVSIGEVTLTLQTEGRRMPLPPGRVPASSSSRSSASSSARPRPRPTSSSSSSTRSSSSRSSARSLPSSVAPTIRIRLTSASDSPSVTVPAGTTVGSATATSAAFLTVGRSGSECTLTQGKTVLASGSVVRLVPGASGEIGVGDRRYRGVLECRVIDDQPVLINELSLEDYMHGISEEPDTEPYEKQRAFAIAARTYAAFYLSPDHRKFAGMPYDGSDSPAEFQAYAGVTTAATNPRWVKAVDSTAGEVLTIDGEVIKAPYFSSDDGRTRSPADAGWPNFPHAEVFTPKDDPWCRGMSLNGHGVGMSGCGAEGQANDGQTAEKILQYYYPGTAIEVLP